MAAILANYVATDANTGQTFNLTGTLSYADRSVGGGPMPGGEHPAHPIAPGGQPPGIWGGPIDPYPGHPLPEPPGKPTEPPEPPTSDKPPPASGGWGWMASASAWGYFPGPTEAQPKR